MWNYVAVHRISVRACLTLILSGLYWQVVCGTANVGEPWDAPDYWAVAYPISLGLSALGGLFFRNWGWLAGVVVTLAQLPVMLINSEPGPLWGVGLLFLLVLTIPAAALSGLTGWLRYRVETS